MAHKLILGRKKSLSKFFHSNLKDGHLGQWCYKDNKVSARHTESHTESLTVCCSPFQVPTEMNNIQLIKKTSGSCPSYKMGYVT